MSKIFNGFFPSKVFIRQAAIYSMNLFLALGAAVAVVIIAAAFVYSPQPGIQEEVVKEEVREIAEETVNQEQAIQKNTITEPAAEEAKEEQKAAEQPVLEVPIDSRPDISITGITIDPKTPLVNELVTFTANVINFGNSGADSFSYTLSPLTDQVSIVSAASIVNNSLAPKDTTTISMKARIATPGPAKIKSTVDNFNNIDEINEDNNQLIVPFRIYTKQNWAGCFGNGKSVCAEFVDENYFSNHTSCKIAYNCTSFVTSCDASCPFPR